MNRIANAFANGKAFIGFVTGGDPDLATTAKLLEVMAANGADLIEVGLPFSDPIAEGPVIQEADERALAAGCTIDKLFDLLTVERQKISQPLVILTYMNPVFVYGKEKFLARCQESGVDGLIIPDLPFEEKGEIADDCKKFGVALISLIAPTSKERIAQIAADSEGFVYCVSSLGVTGVRSEITTDIGEMVAQVKAVKDIPCAVGFGIATPEQAAKMAKLSDGAIVGSAIVKIVAKYGTDSPERVGEYVRSMKQAVSESEAK
jgi:tryptophan synthase alpha chain